MALCNYLIEKNIQADCASPIFAGVEAVGYIINRSDIKSFMKANGIVSAIGLNSGAKAYLIQQMGQQPFNGTGSEFQQGEVMNTFNRKVQFIILDNSPEVAEDIVNPMANGEFVVIVENKYKDDTKSNAFEVYGLDKGARATAITEDKYQNMAGWVCELTETETPNSNTFFWDTDYDTTKAALEALLTPAA